MPLLLVTLVVCVNFTQKSISKRIFMPKMKSVRGAAKRFKASKNKIKRGSAFRSHILTKKDQKRKRGLRSTQYVNAANMSAVKMMLGKA